MPGQREETAAVAQALAGILPSGNKMWTAPMRVWLELHFRSRGYSPDESRAMAAATYVTVFGAAINRTTPPESPPPS